MCNEKQHRVAGGFLPDLSSRLAYALQHEMGNMFLTITVLILYLYFVWIFKETQYKALVQTISFYIYLYIHISMYA